MDGIPLGALINGIGIGALLVLLVLMFGYGLLYTKGQVNRIQAAHDAELERMTRAHERALEDRTHDRNEWRTESRIKDQVKLELIEQNTKMLNAFGPTLTDFLQALRRAGVAAKDDEGSSTP